MKMAPSRPINGAGPINTSVIGKIIKKKDSEYSITPMETSTKEGGPKTNVMGKVPIGSLMPKTSYVDSIPVTGKTVPNREEGLCSTNQGIDTMECGWTTCPMDKVE